MGQISTPHGVGSNATHNAFNKRTAKGTIIAGGLLYLGTQAYKHHHFIKAAHAAHRTARRRSGR